MALLLAQASPAAHAATELGGGFNGQLGDVNNPLIVKSGVRVVRVFVDITRNYLTYTRTTDANCAGPWCVSEPQWSNICTQPDGASINCQVPPNSTTAQLGISNILPIYAISNLAAVKSLGCQEVPVPPVPSGRKTACQNVKIILSLKTDFSYWPAQGILDDPTFASQQIVINAIGGLLLNGNLGGTIDYLVLGNEPMFELPYNKPNTQSAAYGNFLVQLATQVNAWKTSQHWDFQVYSGSLDRPGYACCPGNPNHYCTAFQASPGCINEDMIETAIAVINATKTVNQAGPPYIIAGVDLHEHVSSVSDVDNDVAWVNNQFSQSPTSAFKPSFIATEFSLILRWQQQLNSGNPSLCNQINNMVENVAQGTPVSASSFQKYLRRNANIYSEGWFKQFYCALNKNKFEAATYGLVWNSQFPYTQDLLVCPAPTNTSNEITTLPWIMVPAFNAGLLGTSRDPYTAYPTYANRRPTPSYGYPVENPLVFPDFAEIISKTQGGRNQVCR
jgi:hypothetical protein